MKTEQCDMWEGPKCCDYIQNILRLYRRLPFLSLLIRWIKRHRQTFDLFLFLQDITYVFPEKSFFECKPWELAIWHLVIALVMLVAWFIGRGNPLFWIANHFVSVLQSINNKNTKLRFIKSNKFGMKEYLRCEEASSLLKLKLNMIDLRANYKGKYINSLCRRC